MMIDNSGEAKKNCEVTSQSSYNVEEAFKWLEIRDSHNQGGDARVSPYPDRPGERNCSYYMKTGFCGYGSSCRYNHPLHSAQGTQFREELSEREGQPDCWYFLKTGTCKYGFTCKYKHPKDRNGDRPVLLNILGLPMRPDEKSCPHYMHYGSCKFGVACKFHHPDPTSHKTGLLMNGPAAFGSPGSSFVPSSVPAVVGIPVWSSSSASNVSDSHVQSVQTCMPVVFSVSPGMIPSPGWNTYMGSLRPVSSGGIVASNMTCNLLNHGESGSGAQSTLLLTNSTSLHPRERMALFCTSFVGPHGMPLRPGQVACPNYTSYGPCKFGSTPVIDPHPLFGHSYGYSLSFPHPSFNASLTTSSRILQTGFLSEMPLSQSSKLPGWIRDLMS